jgi:hypothetical protein
MVQTRDAEASRRRTMDRPMAWLLLLAPAPLDLPFTLIWEGKHRWDILKDPGRTWEGETIYRGFFRTTHPLLRGDGSSLFFQFGFRDSFKRERSALEGIKPLKFHTPHSA